MSLDLIAKIQEPDLVSGFFMPVIQLLRCKTRNTNILIPINFHILFNNLGLTVIFVQLKLRPYSPN